MNELNGMKERLILVSSYYVKHTHTPIQSADYSDLMHFVRCSLVLCVYICKQSISFFFFSSFLLKS